MRSILEQLINRHGTAKTRGYLDNTEDNHLCVFKTENQHEIEEYVAAPAAGEHIEAL
jgi:hypothetical protein